MRKHWLRFMVGVLVAFGAIGWGLNVSGCISTKEQADTAVKEVGVRSELARQEKAATDAGDTAKADEMKAYREVLDKAKHAAQTGESDIDVNELTKLLPPGAQTILIGAVAGIAGRYYGKYRGFKLLSAVVNALEATVKREPGVSEAFDRQTLALNVKMGEEAAKAVRKIRKSKKAA